jgi:exonuclease VII small subunit
VTSLVSLGPLHEARRELEKARRRYRDAAHALTTVRETLNQAVDLAYQQQSFAPLGNLFNEEEAALALYERAVLALAEAEERWLTLSAALAHEKMLMGQVSRSRMN